MTDEELKSVSLQDAKNDMIGYIRDIIVGDVLEHRFGPEEERAIAIKMDYWNQLFLEKGRSQVMEYLKEASHNMLKSP